jgi:DNA invertase Pin-like site-specific DNA recombinase
MMRHVRRGKADIIATQALDRLARSSRTLITLVDELRRLGVGLYSYRETIDSSSAMGELIFVVFAGLAQFELSVLKERTCAGLQRAVARGKRLGRPPKAAVDILEAQRLIAEGLSKKAVAVRLGVPRTSLLRALNGVSKNASKTGLASA